MNINRDLEKSHYSHCIEKIKEELRVERLKINEAIRSSLKVQTDIIKRMQKEKMTLKKNNNLHKRKMAIRERQLQNTEKFFKKVLTELRSNAKKNPDFYAYSMFGSHNSDGSINQYFVYNHINLDLLHSLCYRHNIILEININTEYQTASMNFTVNPKIHLTNDQMNAIRVYNYNALNYFYRYFAQNKSDKSKMDWQKRK